MLSDFGSHDIWILATASLVAAATSLVGVFLILRRQALIGDASSTEWLIASPIKAWRILNSSTSSLDR